MPSSEIHNCDICGADEHWPIEPARRYIGEHEPPVVCKACGFVYVRERRSLEDIARAWDRVWGAGYTSEWPAVKARLMYAYCFLESVIPGDERWLVDVGAGEGYFLRLCKDHGLFKAYGIEPSAANVAKIRRQRLRCEHGHFPNVHDAETEVGIITLNWTLENTGDCVGILNHAHAMLADDGHVMVSTGSRILVPYKKPMSTYFADAPQDLHAFRFSARSLGRLMAKCGFEVVAVNRYLDTDYLCVIGRKVPDGNVQAILPHDDPNKVTNYFAAWGDDFP